MPDVDVEMKPAVPLWMLGLLLLVAGGVAFLVLRSLYTGSHLSAATEIPGSGYVVKLLGPDMKGHYRYEVVESRTSDSVAQRFLGPVYFKRNSDVPMQAAEVPSAVREEADGVWRITWGKEGGELWKTAYALIDVKNRVVLQDSNGANATPTQFIGVAPREAGKK